jgi:hypothetical protein
VTTRKELDSVQTNALLKLLIKDAEFSFVDTAVKNEIDRLTNECDNHAAIYKANGFYKVDWNPKHGDELSYQANDLIQSLHIALSLRASI